MGSALRRLENSVATKTVARDEYVRVLIESVKALQEFEGPRDERERVKVRYQRRLAKLSRGLTRAELRQLQEDARLSLRSIRHERVAAMGVRDA